MRVLLVAWGSRGDVQPFIALGRGLAEAGYDVSVAAGTDSEAAVLAAGLGFHPFAVDLTRRMQDPLARRWLSGSASLGEEILLMQAAFELFAPVIADGLIEMLDGYDAFVCGALTFEALGQPAARAGKPVLIATLQPAAPTRSGTAMMFPLLPRRRSSLNEAWGLTQGAVTYSVIRSVGREVRRRLGMSPRGFGAFVRAARTLPVLLGVSPLILPPAPDWVGHVTVTGYWVDPVPADFRPPQPLADFLAAGPPPVYAGFGSMPSLDPAALRELVLAAIRRAGHRAVVSGSLHTATTSTELIGPGVMSVGSIPHEWLFARTAGVISHGGAGTTGAALRAGVPVGVVAHIADQPYWGRRAYELGVGAPVLRRPTLTTDALATQIRTVIGTPALTTRAAALGARLQTEDGVAVGVAAIRRVLEP